MTTPSHPTDAPTPILDEIVGTNPVWGWILVAYIAATSFNLIWMILL